MAEGDIVSVGLALDTGQLLTGAQQATSALERFGTTADQTTNRLKQTQAALSPFAAGLQQNTTALQQNTTALQQSTAAQTAFTTATQTSATTLGRFQQGTAAATSVLQQLQTAGQGATRQMMGLQAATVVATGAQQQAVTQANALAQAFANIATQATNAANAQQQAGRAIGGGGGSGSILGGLARGVGLPGVLGAAGAAYAGVRFGQDVIQTTDTYDALKQGLTAATGSTEAGARAFQLAHDTALLLHTELGPLAEGFTRLATAGRVAGVSVEDSGKLMAGAANLARQFGGGADQAKNVMDGLSKLLERETIPSFTTLVRMFASSPQVIDLMAKGLHMSNTEFRDYANTGQALTSVILPGLLEQLGKVGGAAGEGAGRAKDAFRDMKTSWDDLLNSIGGSSLARAFMKGFGQANDQLRAVITTGNLGAGFQLATGPYADLLNKYAAHYGVDPRLAQTVQQIENAQGDMTARSPRGALGLMQVLPSTGKGLGFSEAQLLTAEGSIEAGVKYLAQLQSMPALGGDLAKVLAAYNVGPGAVGQEIPIAARGYVTKGLSIYRGLGGVPSEPLRLPGASADFSGSATAGGGSPFPSVTAEAQAAAAANDAFKQKVDALNKSLTDLAGYSAKAPSIYGSLAPSASIDDRIQYLTKSISLIEPGVKGLIETVRPEKIGALDPKLLQAQQQQVALYAAQKEQLANLTRFKQIDDETNRKITQEADQQAAEEKRNAEQAQAQRVQALQQLQQLRDGLLGTTEARKEDTAAQLANKTVGDDLLHNLALGLEAEVKEAIALEERGKAFRATGDAIRQHTEDIDTATDALTRYRQQVELSGGGRITPEARAYTTALKTLGPLLPTEQGPQAQSILEMFRQQAAEAEPEFKKLQSISDEFAGDFITTMAQAAESGKLSFRGFAESVLSDISRILQQQFVRPALSGLVQQGLSAAIDLLGAGTTPTGALDVSGLSSDQITALNQATYPTLFPARDNGGDVIAGQSYWVGTGAQPELFTPSSNGTMTPAGQRSSGGAVVNIHVYGVSDAQSFQRSQGNIQHQMLMALAQAQRRAA